MTELSFQFDLDLDASRPILICDPLEIVFRESYIRRGWIFIHYRKKWLDQLKKKKRGV